MLHPHRFILLASLFVGSLGISLLHCGGDDGAAEGPVATPQTPADEAGVAEIPVDPPTPGINYLIIAGDTLTASADHYKTYRESAEGGGHKAAIRTVSSVIGSAKENDPASKKITAFVKAQYQVRDATKPFFVLLLGDASEQETFAKSEVPAGHYVDEDDDSLTITTDNVYADMTGDHIPDLAIGRIPVANDAEADGILERTKTYESKYEVGEWNRRLSLFASTSGFGEPVDTTIEGFVFKMVEELPYEFDLTLTYAKQTSPYVYVPEKFSDKVYERLNEGSLMMAYVGHGETTGFTTLDWSGQTFPIFDTAKLSTMNIAHKPPILTLIACLTGRFSEGESVSESILKSPHGPIAVLSSTQISHPYPNALFIRELAKSLTATPRLATVGELFQSTKERSITVNDDLRKEIEAQVGALVPAGLRASLKRTHLYMYTLLGDPGARVSYTKQPVDLTVPATAKVGTDIAVTASMTGLGDGAATVTLESTRSTIVGAIKPVPADGAADRDAVITSNYAVANDRSIAKQTVQHTGGKLPSTTLSIPATTPPGTYYVKVYADDGKVDAMGSKPVVVTAN